MPILAMHLIGNSTCLRGAIQDHYGPLVIVRGSQHSLNFQISLIEDLARMTISFEIYETNLGLVS